MNGTGEAATSFDDLALSLGERYRCVATDARDVGASSRSADAYTPRDLAADAAGIIDALGLGACHVVGFSLGGATAMELALLRPDLVRSLVLLSTWARSDKWFRRQMANWLAIRRAHPSDETGFLRALDVWMFSPVTLEDRDTLRRIREIWDRAPRQEADAWCRQCDADAAHDVVGRLGGVGAPTLVLVGADDICTPSRCAIQLVGAIPDARLQIIDDAGHCALFERPGHVHEAIAGFLDAQVGGGESRSTEQGKPR